jgi:dTMP kinase
MFITFEGPEGSGKTLQTTVLVKFLEQAGYNVLATREPGGTNIGNQIRAVLLDLKNTAMQARTEILLFQASRAQLVEEVVLPNLAQGKIVLCDRYADSTIAYQGYGYQVNLEQLRAIVNFATGGLKPDLTLFLDIDVEEGLRRRADGGEWNRLDAYDLAFYQRVRQGFHQMVKDEPDRWEILDAGQPPYQVHSAIQEVVLKRLEVKKIYPEA